MRLVSPLRLLFYAHFLWLLTTCFVVVVVVAQEPDSAIDQIDSAQEDANPRGESEWADPRLPFDAAPFEIPAEIETTAGEPPIKELTVLRRPDKGLRAKIKHGVWKLRRFLKRHRDKVIGFSVSFPAGMAMGYLVSFLCGGVPILGVVAGSAFGDLVFRQTLAYLKRRRTGKHLQRPHTIQEFVKFLKQFAKENTKPMLIAAVVGVLGFFAGNLIVKVVSPVFDALLQGMRGAWDALAVILVRLLHLLRLRVGSSSLKMFSASASEVTADFIDRMVRMASSFMTSHSLKTVMSVAPSASKT